MRLVCGVLQGVSSQTSQIQDGSVKRWRLLRLWRHRGLETRSFLRTSCCTCNVLETSYIIIFYITGLYIFCDNNWSVKNTHECVYFWVITREKINRNMWSVYFTVFPQNMHYYQHIILEFVWLIGWPNKINKYFYVKSGWNQEDEF